MSRYCYLSFAVFFVFLTLLSSRATAQLGPASYRSLQVVVHNSELVLLGKITKIDGQRELLGQMTCKIRFKVEEVIKGGHRAQGYFYLFAERKQVESWIASGARLVLNSPFETYGNSESAGITVDLSKPKLQRLSLGDDGVLTEVNTTKELLEILRKTAQQLPGVMRIRTYQMPTEPGFVKEANLVIQDGFPLVFVPVDKPLETWAKRVINGETELPCDRGARALMNFKSEQNIKWVKLAIDTATDEKDRAVLEAILREWNVPVPSR